MKKPKVIVNVFSSVDGRITTSPDRNVMEWTAAGIDGDANTITHRLYDDLDCDAMLSGSESLMVWGSHWVELEKPIYVPKKSKSYIVFDGRGRINWQQTKDLVVVTREDVPGSYIEQLREKKITYILAGRGNHIDIRLALHHLYEMGFRTIGLSGGGSINGAFLRAGVIDEISLVLAPLVIGGRTTPTTFDCEDLLSVEGAASLELLQSKPLGNKGAVWLHYRVGGKK
ncbi:RibD family protein [Bacillus salacetis]|uniref:RibD family protein n=1 Tax=Bacillus salacetis TaxID=2315464 RepID=UPI00144450E5|nr:RibD family protein [Bacillus salacetis]